MAMRLLLFFLVVTLGASGRKEDQAEMNRLDLQGSWRLVEVRGLGGSMSGPVVEERSILFTADRFTRVDGAAERSGGSFALRPELEPKSISLTGTRGFEKGKTQEGTYALHGDTLWIAFGVDGSSVRE